MKTNNKSKGKKDIKDNTVYNSLDSDTIQVYPSGNLTSDEVAECVKKICDILKSTAINTQFINSKLEEADYKITKVTKKKADPNEQNKNKKKEKPDTMPNKYIVAYSRMCEILRKDDNIPLIKMANVDKVSKDNSSAVIVSSMWNIIKKVLDYRIGSTKDEKFSKNIDILVNTYDTETKDSLTKKLQKIEEEFMNYIHEEIQIVGSNDPDDKTNVLQDDYIRNRFAPIFKQLFKRRNSSEMFKKKEYEEAYDQLIKEDKITIKYPEYDEKRSIYAQEYIDFFEQESFRYILSDRKDDDYAKIIEKEFIEKCKIDYTKVTLMGLYFICKCIEKLTKDVYNKKTNDDTKCKEYIASKKTSQKPPTRGVGSNMAPSYKYKPKNKPINQPNVANSMKELEIKEIKKEEEIKKESEEEIKKEEIAKPNIIPKNNFKNKWGKK